MPYLSCVHVLMHQSLCCTAFLQSLKGYTALHIHSGLDIDFAFTPPLLLSTSAVNHIAREANLSRSDLQRQTFKLVLIPWYRKQEVAIDEKQDE